MTTLAYHQKDGQIAVDSQSCIGGLISSDDYNKIKINDYGIWVLCGAVCDIEDFMSLQKNDEFSRNVDLEVGGLLIADEVVYYVFMNERIFCKEVVENNFTRGSGGDFALSALDFGKSAKEAVEYAMTRDIYTGGKVQVIDVKTGKVIS